MDFLFTQLFHMMFDKVAKVITDVSAISIDIFKQDAVSSLLNFFQMLGWIVITVGILFGIANYCINRIEGNFTPLDELFMNIFKSIIATCFIQPGALFIFNLANIITASIKNIVSVNAQTIKDVVSTVSSIVLGYGVFWAIILGWVFFGLLFFLFIQSLKRGGMYLMQIMAGYLYIFGIPSGNTEGILDWSRQTVALAATNVLQISALIIAMNLIINKQFWDSVVVLLAATSADKIAGRFGMSAGGRQTIGNMARGISSSVSTVSQVVRVVK